MAEEAEDLVLEAEYEIENLLDDLEEVVGEAGQEELQQLEEDVDAMIDEAYQEIEEMIDDLMVKALKKYL